MSKPVPNTGFAQCPTLAIAEYRERCRTTRAAEYCSLLGPVRHNFMRTCSIRLFGSAYQPGVLLGFGAPFPSFGAEFARVVRLLGSSLGLSARQLARFGCSLDSYLSRSIRFDCPFVYAGYSSL